MSETDEKCDIKCNRCKTYRYPKQFVNDKGRGMKTCDICRNKAKILRNNYKCEHGKSKYHCNEDDCTNSYVCEHGRRKTTCKEGNCKGSEICIHGRMKSTCKEGDCKGSQICIHGRIKIRCIEGDCKGSQICIHRIRKSECKQCSNPIKITIKSWIHHSKQSDKKYNRLDLIDLIDTEFCQNLIEEYPNCNYCQIELQYTTYQDNLATIERINNSLGHIKSNCVIACKKCNISKVGSN